MGSPAFLRSLAGVTYLQYLPNSMGYHCTLFDPLDKSRRRRLHPVLYALIFTFAATETCVMKFVMFWLGPDDYQNRSAGSFSLTHLLLFFIADILDAGVLVLLQSALGPRVF